MGSVPSISQCIFNCLNSTSMIFFPSWMQSMKYSNYVRKSVVQLVPVKQKLMRGFSSREKTQSDKSFLNI